MGFRVQIRLHVPPAAGGVFVEFVSPVARGAGLRLRNDVPGLIEGADVSLEQLGSLLLRLGEIPLDLAASSGIVESGLINDVWIHISREAPDDRAVP